MLSVLGLGGDCNIHTQPEMRMAGKDDKSRGKKPPKPFSLEDDIQHWKDEYLEIRELVAKEMEELNIPQQEIPDGSSSFPEKRQEPRYIFMEDSKIYGHMGPKAFPILNISIGGISFYSDSPFEIGTKLLMSALGMIALEVDVLNCEMEETDADMMEFRYRVRAKFGPHVNGYQVYVLAREMHLQNIEENVKDSGSSESGS